MKLRITNGILAILILLFTIVGILFISKNNVIYATDNKIEFYFETTDGKRFIDNNELVQYVNSPFGVNVIELKLYVLSHGVDRELLSAEINIEVDESFGSIDFFT